MIDGWVALGLNPSGGEHDGSAMVPRLPSLWLLEQGVPPYALAVVSRGLYTLPAKGQASPHDLFTHRGPASLRAMPQYGEWAIQSSVPDVRYARHRRLV